MTANIAITNRSLHDQVVSRVRDLIIEGVLEPGSRIDEARLIEELEVSRTPFREALRTLAAEGLVIVRPSKGSIVRKLTREDVFSMLEVLAHLERLAGELACARAGDEQIQALVDLHQRMMECYRQRDRLPYYKLNQEFHSRLAELSKNTTLQDMQANIQARLKRIRYIGNQKPESWAGAVADHEEMVAALKDRDGKRLGDAMSDHLGRTWERVKDSI
ncbi:MAG: GntR family transcriptional regulator [Paracoccus sp. (in: a-proteobacteria)]|jgi:DNA-binding GntR family transcriptional regulator|uniref:GntR family transcriptional regulator n=3 Tax=Paracoccus TaxID=265 RepID=UPI000C3C5EE7|nr:MULTISPECIES: GntR family transcriptional regulator [unclassified Paracoccus (in: a-proteobacteria)]MAN55215.1 GntR family transcriptional regulator [Paracoccus sp. (in: a-proteobacteria)]MBA47909.1 GntR family transcriptional regulator [Paracoccus sp. (in: a-proteobacteria)]MDB2550991.1 GntR family transcriptional regulator [Paracoccus sp. (in: a-proteobacteria)]HIC66526.1 GntR family transcriptional regulator [Paracoccus sp. (in: a-proteobacteria)]|tara:strand:+ start:1452 stop:2105 length:654 start_codon:yes stop_codon:yes gene_type:complete